MRFSSAKNHDIFNILDDILPFGRGFVVMMKVFLDLGDKQDDEDHVVSIAATIFKPTPYKSFVKSWNKFLRNWRASAFHACDFYPGAEEFDRSTNERKILFEKDCKRIPGNIAQHVARVVLVAFRPEEFKALEPNWKERYGTSLHALAVQLCMGNIGLWAQENHPKEQFAYFMESGDPDQGNVSSSVDRIMSNDEARTYMRINSFTIVPKGTARGLEASDFTAWHWNKFYMDRFRKGNRQPRRDFAAFIQFAKEKVASAFLTGKRLDDFLKMAPLMPLIGQPLPGSK
jgi:hypothetical protein